MQSLEFLVQGSEPSPYRVIFHREGSIFAASCTCEADAHGQLCKHRMSLLIGDVTALVSGNAADVPELAVLLEGSEAAVALARLREAERLADEAKKEVSKLKRALVRIMHRPIPPASL